MRVIAGAAKGRTLKSPPSTTRPFTGRAKEGLFSSISDRVHGSQVLDLFAGSGSLAIEALSRGAETAVLVDADRRAVETIKANLAACGFEAEVRRGSVSEVLGQLDGEWDLVFVDPPYAEATDAVLAVVSKCARRLAGDGTLVLHRRAGDKEELDVVGLIVEDDRSYGDSRVVRYRPDPEEDLS